ncbi:HNH endonuclease [Vibrio crassostreae]|uniref:HNH endonuclease n=1 Tax=Vibrio crassostreae TaxID=246167 RepID=UPI001047B6F3|nr:HNH endonuclease [Vibrio crassostreae]TCT68622.1 HNH endonuclease [Vibrio crassostreae]CAK2429260.1 5-methylcytosine-specific restriction enzyme A [Vibrio crassostreae]CAK2882897.1 5-methylcytosine-specific restriction enzyme A [Vibrio crassostreae]
MFKKGQRYSRKEISALIGGQIQGYMGTRQKKVIGVYLELSSNPNAPTEILCGSGKDIAKHGLWLSLQHEPVPIFLKRKTNEWEYQGLFSVSSTIEDESELEEIRCQAGRDYKLSRAINLQEVSEHLEFDQQVTWSKALTITQRAERLSKAETLPKTKEVKTTVYVRNPDVVAEALVRANGTCESCYKPAPFIRKTDNTPYLEVHHKLPLAQCGPDTVDNVLALCPNCHRQAHFG